MNTSTITTMGKLVFLAFPLLLLQACKKDEPVTAPPGIELTINGKPWRPLIKQANLTKVYTEDSTQLYTIYSMTLTSSDSTFYIAFAQMNGLQKMYSGVFTWIPQAPRDVERPCSFFLAYPGVDMNIPIGGEMMLHYLDEQVKRVTFDFNTALRINNNPDTLRINGSLRQVPFVMQSVIR